MNVITGNIMTVTNGVILHQVNCQGVMGSGVAGILRARYPVIFTDYKKFVEANLSSEDVWLDGANLLGRIVVSEVTPTLKVVSMFGQQFFGNDGKKYTSYDALDECLKQVSELFDASTVNFPQFGAGLGGGNWNVIASMIDHRIGPNCTLWVLP